MNSEALRSGEGVEPTRKAKQAVPMQCQIEANLTAAHVMANVPGLRRRVEEMLTGILETAEEIRRLQGIDFATTADQPMRVHIGNYIISYLLDLDRRVAKVVFVEIVSRQLGKANSTKAG